MTSRRTQRPVAVAVLGLALVGACTGSDAAEPTTPSPTAPVATTPVATQVGTDGPTSESTAPPSTSTTTTTAPAKDIVTRSPDAVGDGSPPEGLGTATVRVTAADGTVCEVCMWLADDATERSTGLMGVQDLGGPVGMAFLWDDPTAGNFFMFATPTPLSIAWFDESGAYLSETDMAPCLDESSGACDRYGTTGPYTLAVEMFQAQLGKIGIGPGSTAEIIERFDSSECDPTH